MKYLRRPTQLTIPRMVHLDYVVTTKAEYLALDKVWKQLVIENKDRGYLNCIGPLTILRNVMLGRDMYTGFTPCFRQNDLNNGRGFCDGFSNAYSSLIQALKSTRVNHLQNSCYRMLLVLSPYPSVGSFKDKCSLPPSDTFYCQWYMRTYIARVNQMVIELQESGTDLRGKSYNDLFDMFDKDYTYNVIRKSEYLDKKFQYDKFQDILERFGRDYITLEKKLERVTSVVLQDDPTWLYESSDGVDQRKDPRLASNILITTRPKYSTDATASDMKYCVPITHLWELDWLKEYEK